MQAADTRRFAVDDESDESCDGWIVENAANSQTQRSEAADGGLKRAVIEGDVARVQELLDAGVDVETRLGFEWTPLMYAVNAGNCPLAELLLDRGASANYSTDNYTVLMAACATSSAPEDAVVKCVSLLLSRSAEPNARNRSGSTCLMLAARGGFVKVINVLASHGAELNLQNHLGHTALVTAAMHQQQEVAVKLLQLGADRTVRTKSGMTAADLARQKDLHKMVQVLGSSELPVPVAEVVAPCLGSRDGFSRLTDVDLLLRGLSLEHLSGVLREVTWSDLKIMKSEDLERMGVADPDDRRQLLAALKKIYLGGVKPLSAVDGSSEAIMTFLMDLKQQSCNLTEAVQSVIRGFPQTPSQVVFTCDPRGEAQVLCAEIATRVGDLQKEVMHLKLLLRKADEGSGVSPAAGSDRDTAASSPALLTLGLLGAAATAGLLLLLSLARL